MKGLYANRMVHVAIPTLTMLLLLVPVQITAPQNLYADTNPGPVFGFPTKGTVTSTYGDPTRPSHTGLDIAGANASIYSTDPVYPCDMGVVVYKGDYGPSADWGDFIVVYHGKNAVFNGKHTYSFYSHMGNKNSPYESFIQATPGLQFPLPNQNWPVLGKQGNSGNIIIGAGGTGIHLDWEVRFSDTIKTWTSNPRDLTASNPGIYTTDNPAKDAILSQQIPPLQRLVEYYDDSAPIPVYWLQNCKRYHVSGDVITKMTGSVNYWGWDKIISFPHPSTSNTSSFNLDVYPQGPDFFTTDGSSTGLLVRQLKPTESPDVYVAWNNQRRHIASEEALRWNGKDFFSDIIEVTSSVITDLLPNEGEHIYAVGENAPSQAIKDSFKNLYNNLKDRTGVGWPGDAICSYLGLPKSLVGDATTSGYSGITGKYQLYDQGTINWTSQYGAFEVHGKIFERYQQLSYSGSNLGFPKSNAYPWNGYLRSDFENGYIYWNQVTNQATEVYNNIQYTLTTSITAGSGSIGLNPPGGTYNSGTSVTLTASPSTGYQFSSWSGTNNNGINPTTVTMNSYKSVSASFVLIPPTQYTLTTSIAAGSGSIGLNPPGGTYNSGTSVTLTASPSTGYQFSSWSGTNNNGINPTTVTMNSYKSVSASFVLIPPTQYTLTTSIAAGSGSIGLNPPGGTYNSGTSVTLTASPSTGYQFSSWSGTNNNSINPTTVTMNSNKSVSVNFTQIPILPLPTSFITPGTAVTFKWSAPDRATNYHLQVNTLAGFNGTDLFNAEVGNVTITEVTGLMPGATYFWRVKAGNVSGWSGWSTTWGVLAGTVP